MIAVPTAAGLAFALSAAGMWLLRRARAGLPADVPNARSLHGAPVPRAGGYAIWIGFVPVALAFPPTVPGGWLGWLPPWVVLAAVSGRDDVREVGIGARLAVHALAACWTGVALARDTALLDGSGWMAALAAAAGIALVIAWCANLYNFMDGTDGLAGTMTAIGFASYGCAALMREAPLAHSAPAFFALAAASLPFLASNLPRASMFLGDVGAVPLGFLAAAFGIAGAIDARWPAWFPLLVFLPFAADATLTLVSRILRRERWWEGHRVHYYQRLARMRAGHGGTLVAYATLMAGAAATALACLAFFPAAGWWALAAWSCIAGVLFATIDYHWRKKTNISPRR
jgi:UDP-N-acetylmuramyl pentapeptide phosphotransferase/UDP-N-acetylglucosamine-1-phosphate transferase